MPFVSLSTIFKHEIYTLSLPNYMGPRIPKYEIVLVGVSQVIVGFCSISLEQFKRKFEICDASEEEFNGKLERQKAESTAQQIDVTPIGTLAKFISIFQRTCLSLHA